MPVPTARFSLPLILAGLAATACTSDAPPGGASTASTSDRQCFRPAEVSGFNATDRDTVQVTAGPRRVFELQIVGVCPEIDSSQRIGIRSRGSGWVCQGLDAELIVPSPVGLQTCPITGVRRLSDDEVQASRTRR